MWALYLPLLPLGLAVFALLLQFPGIVQDWQRKRVGSIESVQLLACHVALLTTIVGAGVMWCVIVGSQMSQ